MDTLYSVYHHIIACCSALFLQTHINLIPLLHILWNSVKKLEGYGFDCFCLARCSRIGENLEQSLPNLMELILTSNNIQELVSPTIDLHSCTIINRSLSFKVWFHWIVVSGSQQGDLDPLATVKSLTLLRYLLNKQLFYTLYCVLMF